MKYLVTATTAYLALSTIVRSATLPFSENFDAYDNTTNPGVTPTGFSESRGSDWTVQDTLTGNDYRHALTEINSTNSTINLSLYTATVPITNAAGNNFTMSATMRIDAASATTTHGGNRLVFGLNYLGSEGFAPDYTAEIVVLSAGTSGSMRISEDDAVRATAPIAGGITLGVPFTLTLAATYAGPNNLTMNFTLSSGTNSTTVSFADTTPRTGQLFGFRDLVGTGPQSTVAFNVHYDNLSIAVPEPSVLGLLATGAVLCTRRRRVPVAYAESPLKPRFASLSEALRSDI